MISTTLFFSFLFHSFFFFISCNRSVKCFLNQNRNNHSIVHWNRHQIHQISIIMRRYVPSSVSFALFGQFIISISLCFVDCASRKINVICCACFASINFYRISIQIIKLIDSISNIINWANELKRKIHFIISSFRQMAMELLWMKSIQVHRITIIRLQHPHPL